MEESNASVPPLPTPTTAPTTTPTTTIDTKPTFYEVGIDNLGNYIDVKPIFSKLPKGILCLCGTRKYQLYTNSNEFTRHCKTDRHREWLRQLNNNKYNYYAENVKLNDTIRNQQIIIKRLEQDVIVANKTIALLTEVNDKLKNPGYVSNILDL